MIKTGARGVWYVESAASIIWDILCVNEQQGGGEALEEVQWRLWSGWRNNEKSNTRGERSTTEEQIEIWVDQRFLFRLTKGNETGVIAASWSLKFACLVKTWEVVILHCTKTEAVNHQPVGLSPFRKTEMKLCKKIPCHLLMVHKSVLQLLHVL